MIARKVGAEYTVFEDMRQTFADPEGQQARRARRAFERVAGLAQQVGNVDRGQRVRALDDENVAGRHAREQLARLERGQRALQPAHIGCLFRHLRP